MGQVESQNLSEKSSNRLSTFLSRPSHSRSQSAMEGASTMPLSTQSRTRASIPPIYSPTDPAPNRESGERSRPSSPPLIIPTTNQVPPLPPVSPARSRRGAASPTNGHGRSEIQTHHTFGFRDHRNQPLNPLVSRTLNNGDNRTNQIVFPTPPTPNTASTHQRSSSEDVLMQLLKYDTVFLIDDSGSMEGALWEEARAALAEMAEMAAKYDADGIDIHFLNSTHVGIGVSAAGVNQLFKDVNPAGNTPTGDRLDELLTEYIRKLKRAKDEAETGHPEAWQQLKPVNFLVITDGAPTDDPESVIVAAAQRLDAGEFVLSQVGIQFIQIGDDSIATEALRSLDDDLAAKYNIRDMVDTTLYAGGALDGPKITKILLGGINRREDRRSIPRVASPT